jgi:hypothetical protein
MVAALEGLGAFPAKTNLSVTLFYQNEYDYLLANKSITNQVQYEYLYEASSYPVAHDLLEKPVTFHH